MKKITILFLIFACLPIFSLSISANVCDDTACSYANFTCPSNVVDESTGLSLITKIDPERGKSACEKANNDEKKEYKQICWKECKSESGRSTYYSCCRELSAREKCDKKIYNYSVQSGTHKIYAARLFPVGDTSSCHTIFGTVIGNDKTGVCCDYNLFDGNDEPTNVDLGSLYTNMAQRCSALSREGYAAYMQAGKISDLKCKRDGYNVAWYASKYLTQAFGTDAYLCCVSKDKAFEEDYPCTDTATVLVSWGERLPIEYKTTEKRVNDEYWCDTNYSLVSSNDSFGCCKWSSTEGTEIPGLEIDLEAVDQLQSGALDNINPLNNSQYFSSAENRTPGGIINRAMTTVVFPIAGIALFLLILWGGFQIIQASLTGKQNYIDLGKQRITAAVIGFILLFAVYWIWQLVTTILGIG
ncbi:MAG: pilin [bacterium]|nr:pilin [bacterium]